MSEDISFYCEIGQHTVTTGEVSGTCNYCHRRFCYEHQGEKHVPAGFLICCKDHIIEVHNMNAQRLKEARQEMQARAKAEEEAERQSFIEGCTKRDMASGPMSPDELLQRLDIILKEFKDMPRAGRDREHAAVVECLQGALIRLSQTYYDPQVSAKIYELVSLTSDIR